MVDLSFCPQWVKICYCHCLLWCSDPSGPLWPSPPFWSPSSSLPQMFQIVSFYLAQPETRSPSKEPGFFQWSIVFGKAVLGTSGGEGVPPVRILLPPCSFLEQTELRDNTSICWCECMFLHLCVENLAFTPVFPLSSCMVHSSVSLHVWDFLLWRWERCLPFSTKYLFDRISVFCRCWPFTQILTPLARPPPSRPPPPSPSLHTGWAAEALPPTPAFLSSACCFIKSVFPFLCVCVGVCVSILCAYLCLLLHVCLLLDGLLGRGNVLSRSALGSEWKEPSWTRWGVPPEPHGGAGHCIFKADRPGLQRSIAGGWPCHPQWWRGHCLSCKRASAFSPYRLTFKFIVFTCVWIILEQV